MSRPVSLLLRFLAIAAFGTFAVAMIAVAFLPEVSKLPESVSFKSPAKLALPALPESSKIVTEAGEPMGQLLGAENREIVPIDQVSEAMRNTLLAVEDSDFYVHDGVSAKSVFRALRANSEAGEVSQGGSTITQQLVKLSLVGNERSLARKLKEASLALQLEDQMCEGVAKKDCKDKILEQYLNTVYFGRGAYGIQAAAQTYFNKTAAELNVGESAVLTSLIRNPTGYDPIKYPKVAAERRRVVLLRMVEEKVATQAEADYINASPLPTQSFGRPAATTTQNLTYVERKIRDELVDAEWLASTEELRRYLIFNGGLKITTTIDPRAQQLAEAAAAENPVKASNPNSQVAMVTVDTQTGGVRAVVGEVDIGGQPIEIAQPLDGRSSGSSFKPFTLIAAIEAGYPVNSTISGAYMPLAKKKQIFAAGESQLSRNYPEDCPSQGQVALSKALAESNNCVFMRLQGAIGFEKVKQTAAKLGLTESILDPLRGQAACFTIGCDALVRPIDMADAYATIGNDGKRNPAHFISKVEDRNGTVLYEYQPSDQQVIAPDVARQATSAMQSVITGGTARAASLGKRPAAGKTGTTEVAEGANTDLWFVGFTPQATTAVWIGNPLSSTEGLRGGNIQGGRSAAVVWHDFMASYLANEPVAEFPAPAKSTKAQAITDPWVTKGTTSAKPGSGTTATRPRTTTPGATTPGATTPRPTTPGAATGTTPSSGNGSGQGQGGGQGGGQGNGKDKTPDG